jgi:hypothetical protein
LNLRDFCLDFLNRFALELLLHSLEIPLAWELIFTCPWAPPFPRVMHLPFCLKSVQGTGSEPLLCFLKLWPYNTAGPPFFFFDDPLGTSLFLSDLRNKKSVTLHRNCSSAYNLAVLSMCSFSCPGFTRI